jgi:hypothetical protein
MKDLYAKLGVQPSASAREIAEILKQKPELASIGTILLNPEKRAVYDRAYSTLKTIGALRHRLGLDKADSWFLKSHPNFAPSLSTVVKARHAPQPTDAVEQAKQGVEDRVVATPAKEQKSLIQPLSAVIVVIAILAALYFLMR